ncbi:MAG: AAA domain-containing protein [bacterium]
MTRHSGNHDHDNSSNTDIKPEIQKLVLTIKKLMPVSRGGWVSWRNVAKEQEGSDSEEFVIKLSALAKLPEWTHLFATKDKVVKLSEKGIIFANAQQIENLTELQQIADAVRQYASRLERIKLKVEHITKVARVGNKFVQAVYVDLAEEIVPSETPVEFRPQGGGITHGKIVGQDPDGGVLYVALDNEVLETSLPAFLSIDRGFLLRELAERIRSLSHLPPLIEPILHKNNSTATLVAGQDSGEVADGLIKLQTPWTRFLWGPPGAGKTFALGRLITRLLQAEPEGKILIVAPSNRAVDVAVEQLLDQVEKSDFRQIIEQRKILRFGYPRKIQIIERPELLGPTELDELNKKVKQLSAQITKVERERNSSAEVAVLRAGLIAAQEEVKNAVVAHIRNSQVVATTTTLAYLSSSPIPGVAWSTVLVDEVTMVTTAMCTFLASLAQKRLLLAGDPRQLGPVYENSPSATSEDFEWMGRDIFDKSGICSGIGEQRQIIMNDARLARITSQRRCAPEIWSRVEHLYPNVNNRADKNRLQKLIELPPCSGHSVVLLDTSQLGVCEKAQRSWKNKFTAELAMEVACTIASEALDKISIAIISPYRAQVRLLKKAIMQEQRADRSPYKEIELESGTVHQFQGSDADVVIFDMVDGAGRSGPGALLRGDTGIRLVNVAITRAKGKFILLADKTWCERSFSQSDNPILWDLIMGRETEKRLQVSPPIIPIDDDIKRQRENLESPMEQTLFEAMSKFPELTKVMPQYVIRDEAEKLVSRADFAFPEIKYAVYCDGKQWYLKEDRWQRDLRQRIKLTELEWSFSVFTGSEISRNADECAAQIQKALYSRWGKNKKIRVLS